MATAEVRGFILGGGARPLAIYPGNIITMGRDPQNTLCIADVLSSRNHAVVECLADGNIYLRDLGSTNGTWLNNERLPAHQRFSLHSGDSIRIGGKLLSFSSSESTENKQFGQRLTRMDTVKDGLFYKDGKIVDVNAPTTAVAGVDDRFASVLQTQVVAPVPSGEEPSLALAGSLNDQNLAQIIQYLHTNQKTGELFVKGKNRDGLLAFDNGNIVFAQSADRQGLPAIYACARERKGMFKFQAQENVGNRPRNVTEPVMQIIFECCKRIDETELAGL